MTLSYILIDFENVQPKELGAFGGGDFKVMVFIGPAQPSVPVGLASALQALGHAGSYVHVAGRGPNALDMHIAYYIGRIAASESGAVFHIISRDRDYDPLIRHLAAKRIACTRWNSIGEMKVGGTPAIARATAPKALPKAKARIALPAPAKAATKPPVTDRAKDVADNLRKRAKARPSTVAALKATIKTLFRAPPISDAETDRLVDDLKKRGVIAVKDDKISYPKS